MCVPSPRFIRKYVVSVLTATPRGCVVGIATRAHVGLYGKHGLSPVHNTINEQRYKGTRHLCNSVIT